MEIIGNGFLARHLGQIGQSHPGVTILAAGVPRGENSDDEYRREAALVDEVAARCRDRDRLLVFFSTAAMGMYGSPDCRGREDEVVHPPTPYGRHKLALEARIRESGVRHLILRLSYVVGPHGPEHRLLPALIRQIVSGTITVYRNARRDLIDVADLVTIIDKLLGRGVTQEIVNVASGESIPIHRIVDHIEAALGINAQRRLVDVGTPHWVSVQKLRTLVPEVATMGFQPGYYRTVIDRYVHSTAAELGLATP